MIIIKEVDKGYSRQVYQALDDSFKDSDGKAELVYISDAVDMWLFNTKKLYDEIFNKRRKATSIAYEALIDLFQDTVDGYDVKVRVTSEMVKQWFKRAGLSYIDALKPVVDKIEEEREEAFSKKESVKKVSVRSKRMTESSDEIARKLFVSLVKDTFDGGYIVLNDGNFVCKISAKDDKDAERQFNDFLKTDWKQAWRDGTLPRYYGESVIRKSRSRRYKRMTESSRRKYTQKELRNLVRTGEAEDITNYSFEEANDLYKRGYDVVGVSSGTYGINGALLKMRDTDELMAICARNSTLMQLV